MTNPLADGILQQKRSKAPHPDGILQKKSKAPLPDGILQNKVKSSSPRWHSTKKRSKAPNLILPKKKILQK